MFIGLIDRIGAGRQGEINNGLGQMNIAFRHAEKMACLVHGNSQREGLVVGQANVLCGKADKASGNVKRVFPIGEYSPSPCAPESHD